MSWQRWLMVFGLVTIHDAAFASPPTTSDLGYGLTAIERGAPVPIRWRPAPAIRRPGVAGGIRPMARAEYLEPTEFGAIIEFDGTRQQLEARGLRVGTQAGSRFTLRLRRDEVALLRGLPGLRRAQLARYQQPLLDQSLADIRANLEQGSDGGNPPQYSGRTGQGVIVGLVDTGVDFTRPDFNDASGQTRILSIWDQTDNLGPHPAAGGPGVPGYSYGSEYPRSQLINSPGTVRQADGVGHGTLVAGILCGNGVSTGCSKPAYRYVGVAPEAEMIVVKTDYSDASIIDGVEYAFTRAAALGRDCVVNLSLGSQSGPHDGSDDLSSSISALTGPGRIVVAAAGNSQTDDIHGKLTTSSTTPGVDRFGLTIPSYSPNGGTFNDFVVVAGWYDPTAHVVIRVRGPNPGDTLSAGVGAARALNTAGGKIVLIHQNSPLGFGGTTKAKQFEFEVYDSLASNTPTPGPWLIDVVPDGASDLGKRADIWIYKSQFGGFSAAYVTTSLDATTLVGEPADADSVIAVAAHTTKLKWYSCAQGDSIHYVTGQNLGEIAYFSSRGPRRDGVIKPDISAPGLGVASVHSAQAGSIETNYDVDDGIHEIALGTSFSSPHVAGGAALFLQSDPGAVPSKVKLAFTTHARGDYWTGSLPNAAFGAGKLDVYSSLDHSTPVVAVAAPFGGEAWVAGTTHAVNWTATGPNPISSVDVDYSLHDRLGPWVSLLAGGSNSGSLQWNVPATLSDSVIVRITAHDAMALQTTSYSGRFRIVATPPGGLELAVHAPYPNPARSSTQLRITMPAADRATVSIIGVDGRLIWKRELNAGGAGDYSLDWNGRFDSGDDAPSGIYYVQVRSSFGTKAGKLVFLR